MRAARFYDKFDIRIEDIPTPEPKDGEILIDVAWGGICGTDLHEYLIGPLTIPTKELPNPLTGDSLPVTLGHEFCGHVSQAPEGAVSADGTPIEVGQPVMVDPRLNCRTCFSCTDGSSNLCSKWVRKIDGQKGNPNHVIATWCLALELTLFSIAVLVQFDC